MKAAIVIDQTSIRKRFALFVEEILREKECSKEELGRIVGVSGTAVQGWTGANGDQRSVVDPLGVKVGTFFALAQLRGWSGDQLYEYLTAQAVRKKSVTPQAEIVDLLCRALEIAKQGVSMREWAEFLEDLKRTIQPPALRLKFAESAGISEGQLEALLSGELILHRKEQIYVAVLKCGFPVLDRHGNPWNDEEVMSLYGVAQDAQRKIENGNGKH